MGIIACRIQEDELPPQSRESLLANAFLKQLIKQSQESGLDTPYVRPDNIRDVLIDGHVDMLAAATAALVDFENWERAQQ
ncbi:hypothetical protein WILDE_50 [Arthrobacter phage Wilde]|uniref:Uncharacterized protein n=1 Tax=Arthrobacter phage Wilde TaxID=1772323 RepID=A0A0U4K2V5_9CAUD|nr:hypothetical protein WILDE_50 [Arthrobacter phage Wilde]